MTRSQIVNAGNPHLALSLANAALRGLPMPGSMVQLKPQDRPAAPLAAPIAAQQQREARAGRKQRRQQEREAKRQAKRVETAQRRMQQAALRPALAHSGMEVDLGLQLAGVDIATGPDQCVVAEYDGVRYHQMHRLDLSLIHEPRRRAKLTTINRSKP